jgi:spore germination protein GerM
MSPRGRVTARAVTGAVALGAALALAGCGIPADSQPHSIVPPAPYRAATSTAAPASPGIGALTETLYLARNDTVVAVTRPVEVQPDAQRVLADLAAGPNSGEQAQGLSSVLAGSTVVQGVSVDAGLATVALGEGLDGASSTNVLAMAQIVCTLDALPDVNAVVFTRAGVRASVPRGDASQTKDPVSAVDYAQKVEPR